MDEEKYLRQYLRLRAEIRGKRSRQKRLRELCEKITVDMTREKVQSSRDKDRLSDTVSRLVDLEAETLEDINNCLDVMMEIEDVIGKVKDPEKAEILQLIYIEGKTVTETARELGRARETISRKKREAFSEISQIITPAV